MTLVDALGRFLLLLGRADDMKGVAPLIKGISFDALQTDKAFDADWLGLAPTNKMARIVYALMTRGGVSQSPAAVAQSH